MKRYRNKSGDSGVVAYESGADYINIEFKGGANYAYNYLKPGKLAVEKMKALAIKGFGLSTFISR